MDTYAYTQLFGRDTGRLLVACTKIMRDWLHPYEGCYYPSNKLEEIRVIQRTRAISMGDALKEWNNTHPEEEALENQSKDDWRNERDRQFRIVYGIARKHHLYLHWHGNDTAASCGDRWTVYKNHRPVARIQI